MQQLQINELEKTVLGCLMLEAPFESVSQYISANDFLGAENQRIFNAIKDRVMAGKPVDCISLLDAGINIEASMSLSEYMASPANASHYAKQLADYSVVRQIRALLADCTANISVQTYLEIISALMTKLDNLIQRDIKATNDWEDVIGNGIAEIENLTKPNSQVLYSGLKSLDEKFEPIHGSRLIILAARPSDGKTALSQQIALESAKRGKSIGIISLEMSSAELAIRSIANSFGLNGTLLARGAEDLAQFVNHESYDQFMRYPIYLDTDSYRLEAVVARLSEWKRKHHIDFAIIDYIGLIEVNSKGNANETLGVISRALKQLCKRLNMPILLLCQLNRLIESENREPRLSDLRESGHVEQDADMVLILRPHVAKDIMLEQHKRFITAYIVKNRNGSIGSLLPYLFDGRTQRFTENNRGAYTK